MAIIGNLIISSLPNKFKQLKKLILKYVDILVLTETKLNDSFPNLQFLVDGLFEPCRIDRSRSGGGVMIYVRDDNPSKLLTKNIFFLMISRVFFCRTELERELFVENLKWR